MITYGSLGVDGVSKIHTFYEFFVMLLIWYGNVDDVFKTGSCRLGVDGVSKLRTVIPVLRIRPQAS